MINFFSNFFRKLRKRNKPLQCKTCKYKSGNKQGWFCKAKFEDRKRYIIYNNICGKNKPTTTPKWCPLKNKGCE